MLPFKRRHKLYLRNSRFSVYNVNNNKLESIECYKREKERDGAWQGCRTYVHGLCDVRV